MSTIKVFVGCDPNDCDLEQMMVLDYSMKKHSSLPVDIHWMQMSRDPNSFWYSNPQAGEGWRTQTWATPFSGFRWGIPAYCNYEGQAIYMDADMLVLTDIAKLWNIPFQEGKAVMAKGGGHGWRYCVAKWNCAEAQKYLLPIDRLRAVPEAHQRMMGFFSQNQSIVQPFDSDWNNIDGEHKHIRDIKILHYSDMSTQFTHKYSVPRLKAEGKTHWFDGSLMKHPRADLEALFDQYYQEALAAGYKLDDYRVQTGYGDLVKESQKGYTGNHFTRG